MRSLALVALMGICGLATLGCGGSSSETPLAASASETQAPAGQQEARAEPQDPIASTAHEFLAAVVAGDTPRATGLLTPMAIAQFEASGQGFASPDVGAPEFTVGQVRQLADDKAAVQCLLSDGDGEAEMVCLLRLVQGAWRVSGVAYDVGEGQSPVILNFEAPETPSPERFVQQPLPSGTPTRTATAPADTANR